MNSKYILIVAQFFPVHHLTVALCVYSFNNNYKHLMSSAHGIHQTWPELRIYLSIQLAPSASPTDCE